MPIVHVPTTSYNKQAKSKCIWRQVKIIGKNAYLFWNQNAKLFANNSVWQRALNVCMLLYMHASFEILIIFNICFAARWELKCPSICSTSSFVFLSVLLFICWFFLLFFLEFLHIEHWVWASSQKMFAALSCSAECFGLFAVSLVWH